MSPCSSFVIEKSSGLVKQLIHDASGDKSIDLEKVFSLFGIRIIPLNTKHIVTWTNQGKSYMRILRPNEDEDKNPAQKTLCILLFDGSIDCVERKH